MSIAKEDYEVAKAWYWHFRRRVHPALRPASTQEDPASLEQEMSHFQESEKRWPAKMRQGLAMAIGDCLEDTAHVKLEALQVIDADFAAAGLPTLSDFRKKFWRHLPNALKRGRIRGDVEYYAVRNMVETLPEAEQKPVWGMLDEYENRPRRKTKSQ